MRPEDLQVNLRPRSSWEAMELGQALLRRHAGAVWRPWLLVLLPLFAVANVAAWQVGHLWLATLLVWWLKPVLEQMVLFVLSRAVFGQAPSAGQALRAQWRFGRQRLAYLTWRRLGPARSLLAPIDLLEGNTGAQRGMRRRALGGPAYPQAALLTAVCLAFEVALMLGSVAAVFMFVPAESLPASLEAFWETLGEGPQWLHLGLNAAALVALAVIGPFYVAAGFGMYLNRRSESEAWDVELAFRRLRERVLARAAPLLLALAAGLATGLALLSPLPVHAQAATPAPASGVESDADQSGGADVEADADAGADAAGDEGPADDGYDEDEYEEDYDPDTETPDAAEAEVEDTSPTLPRAFAGELADDASFRRAARRAYEDPLIGGERTVVRWVPKDSDTSSREVGQGTPDFLVALGNLFALAAEWGLWLLGGVLLVLLLATMRRWLPWLRGSGRATRKAVRADAEVDALVLPETLPDDIGSAARRLWQDGRPRAALALLYRGSVESMVERTGAMLPPGATESQCLRAARQLPDEARRGLFARMVKVWQYAAYAGRLPDTEAFEALVAESQAQWGWVA